MTPASPGTRVPLPCDSGTLDATVTPAFPDLGKLFGHLTVVGTAIRYVGKQRERRSCYLCSCDCDPSSLTVVHVGHLLSGATTSCGCQRRKRGADSTSYRHGGARTPLYRLWVNMQSRCYNPNVDGYRWYGARGITVCDRWREDFAVFQDWALSHGYDPALTIERIDNNGAYCPENCCFIPKAQQALNKRNNHRVVGPEPDGTLVMKTVREWAQDPRCRVSYVTLRARVLRHEWPVERALTTPNTTAATYTVFGEEKSVRQWLEDPRCAVTRPTLRSRMSYDWPFDEALTFPVGSAPTCRVHA